MKKLLCIILALVISGCDILDSDKDPDFVYIRVANSSSIDFNSVYLSFPGAEYTFVSIKSGRSTPYHIFEQAYRYGYIEIKTDRDTYILQPIDYVGESPLKNGQYTFKLGIQDGYVTLESIRD